MIIVASSDMMAVYDDLEKFIEEQKYDVQAFGFDPFDRVVDFLLSHLR